MFEIGNSLREARYRQHLDLPEVEQATKIRARYLRALEEETFDVLPAQTYVKGFLRTYADFLGLEGQLYVDEYNSRYSAEEEHEPVVARRTSSVSRGHRRLERRGVLLALLGIGILLALVIAAFKFSDSGKQAIPNLGTKKQKTTPAATGTQTTTKKTVQRPARFRLFLTAAYGNSWMNVRAWSQNGDDRFNGTLEQGHSIYFNGRRLWINFGNAGNLTATLNGRPVTVPTGGPVLVTRTGITRAPAAA